MHKLWYLALLTSLLLLVACGTPTPSASTSTEGGSTTTEEYAATPGTETGAVDGASTDVEPAATSAAEAVSGEPSGKQYAAAPEMTIDANKTYTAVIDTSKGTMRAELYASEAPITVNNFVFLSREGFYDGVKFHRIVKGFMVQTGDPLGTGTGGPGYSFEDEPVTREYVRGTLAMANSGPDTNGSQFFIVHADAGLPKDYTIFGKLTEGLETLDAIADVPVELNPNMNENSLPTEEVLINSITIEEK